MKYFIILLVWLSLSGTAFASCPPGTTLNENSKVCEAKISRPCKIRI